MALATVPAKGAVGATVQGREADGVTDREQEGGRPLARILKAPGAALEEEQAPETVPVRARGRATAPALEIVTEQANFETLRPFTSRRLPCCRNYFPSANLSPLWSFFFVLPYR